MADLLIYATIPLFVVYFYLFQRTFRVLEPELAVRTPQERGPVRAFSKYKPRQAQLLRDALNARLEKR